MGEGKREGKRQGHGYTPGVVTVGPIGDRASFERLVSEGESAPLEGWDFSWFGGRAAEERPSWGYTALVVVRLAAADAVLDIQTGGGEVFAETITRAAAVPPVLAATESYRPTWVAPPVPWLPSVSRWSRFPTTGPCPFRTATSTWSSADTRP